MNALIRLFVFTSLFMPTLAVIAEGPRAPIAVVLGKTEIAVPVGAPVSLPFEYVNTSDGVQGLMPDFFGIPSMLKLRVTNWKGEESVRLRGEGASGPGRPLGAADMYSFHPGERVQFQLPLHRIYDLRDPGEYLVELLYLTDPADVLLATVKIKVVATEGVERTVVSGYCENPAQEVLAATGGLMVECSVAALPLAEDGEAEEVLLTVFGCQLGPKRERVNHVTHMKVPKGTKVSHAVIGCECRLWTVLQSDSENCLVVWDLLQGTTKTLVPWTTKEIEFGTMAARSGSTVSKVVIAGVRGELKFTSRSAR